MSKDVTRLIPRQLPIIDAVDVDSTWYALRMTPLGKYDRTVLEQFLKTVTDTYAFTQELSSQQKEHYHIVLNTRLDEFDLREKIRIFLKQVFVGPPRRGDANKQYNLSECVDVETSIIYITKDGGEIITSNFDRDKLTAYAKRSYKKYDKEEFATRLKEIKDRIKDTPTLRIENIMEQIVALKATYRQPLNMNYIYQLSMSLFLHNHPEDIPHYVESFLSRVS